MTIDATFWVAIAFFLFIGALVFFKIPQKMNDFLEGKINEIKKELNEAEKLKNEAKILLSDYEQKIDKSSKESKKIIDAAKKESEKNIIETTKKFHQLIDMKKKNAELKIIQMKENALKDIRKTSIIIAVESVKNIIENSIDKNKLDNYYNKSLEQAKTVLRQTKV